MAGLPVAAGSPLASQAERPEWKKHAGEVDAEWAELGRRRLTEMTSWASNELQPKLAKRDANLYYFFGGPDFWSVGLLYPDAPSYLLCGLEPIYHLPDLPAMKPAPLDQALRNLRYSLRTTVKSSFFRTNEMSGDLTRTQLRGVLPLLYVFVARSGAHIEDTQFVTFDAATGGLVDLPPGETPTGGLTGVRIRFRRDGATRAQALYYFRMNVANGSLEANPAFLAFWKEFGPANAFLKAASFILHNEKKFSMVRSFLLDNSISILQDDSGVPYRAFPKNGWSFAYYGRYLRPLPPFQRALQADLVKAFSDGPVQPLSFTTGYRRTGDGNLLLASRKGS